MNQEKIKSSELVIIKNILAWQVAQALGSENEESLKSHALLLAVDFEEDSFFPLMIGDYFSLFFHNHCSKSWIDSFSYILNHYIEKDHHDSALVFFGEAAARKKWAKKVQFDSFDFVTTINGSPKWTHSVQHLFKRDGHLHAVYWFVEVDRFHQDQNAISFLAEHDALTGLYNRHKLNFITEELKKSKETAYFVLMDLDNFKDVNDTYGHSNGDRALVAFAKRLESVFFHKTHNIVFRLGGDEFLVVVTHTEEKQLISSLHSVPF